MRPPDLLMMYKEYTGGTEEAAMLKLLYMFGECRSNQKGQLGGAQMVGCRTRSAPPGRRAKVK
jgi:hypothetical protein